MTDVVMPQMGESIVEGTLTRWLKKPGDRVERDEPLFEISTDKVDTEIPAPAAGTLSEVIVQEGQTVSINTVVARIDDGAGAANGAGAKAAPAPAPSGDASTAAPGPAQTEPEPAPKPESEQPKMGGAIEPTPAAQAATTTPPAQAYEQADGESASTGAQASSEPSGPLSPLVRRMAREHNIDLGQVRGTGAGGRITKQDVEQHLASRGTAQPAAAQQQQPRPAAPVQQAAAPAQAPPQQQVPPPARAEQPRARVETMSNMRQKIAEHMVMSKRVSPHVTTVHRVDMTKIAKMRERNKAAFQERYGFGLTFLPFVLRATCDGLRQFPIVNASIEGNNIIYHNEINLGIAVALENGLIVPVIRNADEKNVVGLQRSVVDLANRARSRQLKPDEVTGGTFSITNFGSFGSVFATPIINQPQVAILGVGTVEKVPVVVDDAIAIRSQAYLALTFDHRLIDGALADQFTQHVKKVLEGWSEQVL